MIKLTQSCGGSVHNSAINGDDVIIWDDQVSHKFEKLLSVLDIPISIQKSYIRKTSGEFSGKIITQENGILPVVKGAKIDLESDPLGSLRQYGKDGLPLYKSKKTGNLIGMIKRVAKYLGGQQSDVSAYLDETGADKDISESEKQFIQDLTKQPVISRRETPKQWVDQVFVAEAGDLKKKLKEVQFSMDYDPDMFDTPSLYSVHKKNESEIRERFKRLHDFRNVAVKRFSPPISRLDTLVDNLNSRNVVTSDNHHIDGFGRGELSTVYERLFQNTPSYFQGKSNDQDSHKTKKSRIEQFHRLNKLIREWETELNAPIPELVTTKVQSWSLLDCFFSFIVYGRKH
jgi:hypothetical protein